MDSLARGEPARDARPRKAADRPASPWMRLFRAKGTAGTAVLGNLVWDAPGGGGGCALLTRH